MDLGLKNKSALILASSKGLGKACALALAREGASVTIGARDPSELAKTAAAIHDETGARVNHYPVDVTDPKQVRAIVDATVAASGRIDILVNNAGGPPFGSFEQFDDEQWRQALELNLMSTVRFSRLVLPDMKVARWGTDRQHRQPRYEERAAGVRCSRLPDDSGSSEWPSCCQMKSLRSALR